MFTDILFLSSTSRKQAWARYVPCRSSLRNATQSDHIFQKHTHTHLSNCPCTNVCRLLLFLASICILLGWYQSACSSSPISLCWQCVHTSTIKDTIRTHKCLYCEFTNSRRVQIKKNFSIGRRGSTSSHEFPKCCPHSADELSTLVWGFQNSPIKIREKRPKVVNCQKNHLIQRVYNWPPFNHALC